MRKNELGIIGLLAALKLVIQFFGNVNYGFHRDELLHLSVSEHLDFGYMEFPPFIAVLGKLSFVFFDYSLFGMRLFPTLARVLILVVCCLMAKELGGKWRALLFAGTCVLAFLPFYRNHTLFQPVAFDQLFWTAGFYFLIRFINSNDKKDLLLTGFALGLGLQNKYTMLIWAFGIVVCLIFYRRGELFKNRWLYFSGLVALLVFLPNLIWQFQHDFPLLKHAQALSQYQLSENGHADFVLDQLTMPAIFITSVIGLWWLLRNESFRWIAVSVVVIFFTMLLTKSKSYYVFPIYPVLFAAGGVQLEAWLRKKRSFWAYIVASSIFLPFVPWIPELTPVLSIERFVQYQVLEENNGRIELTSDYADMFGWNEQVALVDSVYRSLSPEERRNCALWAENYGEAGALKILGKRYGLPNPISRHGSFWLWGHGIKNADVWISLGNEKPSVEHTFEEVTLVKIIYHKYAIDEENGIPLYICRKPKVDIEKWWSDYADHVFD